MSCRTTNSTTADFPDPAAPVMTTFLPCKIVSIARFWPELHATAQGSEDADMGMGADGGADADDANSDADANAKADAETDAEDTGTSDGRREGFGEGHGEGQGEGDVKA